MIYGKNTSGNQQMTIKTSQIIQNQLFQAIFSYYLQISKTFRTVSLIAISNRLNYYIRYAHILILHEIKDMVAASTSMVTVPLHKTDFALLNATHQAMESIHTPTLKQKQTKI